MACQPDGKIVISDTLYWQNYIVFCIALCRVEHSQPGYAAVARKHFIA
jgi:hypothetical protein